MSNDKRDNKIGRENVCKKSVGINEDVADWEYVGTVRTMVTDPK